LIHVSFQFPIVLSKITQENAFGPLYKQLRQQRKIHFITSLVHLWDLNDNQHVRLPPVGRVIFISLSKHRLRNKMKHKTKQNMTFQYYAELLASLPYSSEAETSCLIKEITKIIASDGCKLKDFLKQFDNNLKSISQRKYFLFFFFFFFFL
jgi:hypothetical protein